MRVFAVLLCVYCGASGLLSSTPPASYREEGEDATEPPPTGTAPDSALGGDGNSTDTAAVYYRYGGTNHTLTDMIVPFREKPTVVSETLTYSCELLIKIMRRLKPNHNYTCNDDNNDTDTDPSSTRMFPMSHVLVKDPYIDQLQRVGKRVYAYTTPIIIAVGVVGNVISLCVFMSKTLRKQPACYYLMTLSATDVVVLVVYVLLEWLDRGLPYFIGNYQAAVIRYDGVCHFFLYVSYTSRLISAWLIVIFTLERYIGVCRPLQRREMCTRSFARKMIFSLVVISMVLCAYKPAMSGVTGPFRVCGALPKHIYSSFILDAIFAILTTLIPLIIISSLNFLIIRRLALRNRMQKLTKMASRDHMFRVEITLILLVVSSCFIAVTIPYFVTWLCQFLTNKCVTVGLTSNIRYWYVEYLSGVRRITKTIYFLNYSMNFFLYSLTGASFRRELKFLFKPGLRRKVSLRTSAVSRTQSSTPQSWV